MKIADLRLLVEQRRSIRLRRKPGGFRRCHRHNSRLRALGAFRRQRSTLGIYRRQRQRNQAPDCRLLYEADGAEARDGSSRARNCQDDGFRHAPVHIVVLGDPRVKDSYPIRTKLEKAESHFITGLANATLLIHLAAVSMGLASQYVSDANSPYLETMLKVLLKIPEPLRVYHLVPIGYAKSQVKAPPRRKLDEMVHYESYDMAKYAQTKVWKSSFGH